jgi:hypothetical protein
MILLTICSNCWWLLLASCLGLWGSAWSLNVARRRKKESGVITPIVTMKDIINQKLRTAMANTGKIGLGMILGVALGVGIRDYQLTINRLTYTDIAIVTKFSAQDFLIWPDRMKQQRVQICTKTIVDWHEGEVLDDWTFEQEKDCKRVISYHKKEKGELNASTKLQAR